MSADVTIYTTDYCPYCTRAKSLLAAKGVAYREVNVEQRTDLRSWLVSASGQRTVPQIFINGRPVGGFSELAALDKQGELEKLLGQAPIAGTEPLPQ